MVEHNGLVTNCCIIAKPREEDGKRVHKLLGQIAQIARGEPTTVPHVSLAYFAQVTKTQARSLASDLARLCRQTAPMVFQAGLSIRESGFFSDYPAAVILDIAQTAPMVRVHENLMRRAQIYRMRSRFRGAAWRAHITVLYTSDFNSHALDRVDALAPDLRFVADELVLSYRRDGISPWQELGAYPLLG